MYKDIESISSLVRRFEAGTIPREEWKHAEHLVVALWYAKHSDSLDHAIKKMRLGILNYLRAIGIDFSKEMPYHETLTHFWMKKVFDHYCSRKEYSIEETASEVLRLFGDKNLPAEYYSHDFLFSDRARREFVDGDLKSLI